MIDQFGCGAALGTEFVAGWMPRQRLDARQAPILNDRNAAALGDAPEFAVEGALVYQTNRCGACHIVNGVGMKIGPPLNGLAKRQTRSWVEDHFKDPQKLSPGSIMPPYRLSPKELENITAYLFALPE